MDEPASAGGAPTDGGPADGAGGGHPVIAYRREMGLDHRDFFRILPRAMGDVPYEVDGTRVRASIDGGTLTIELGPEQVRRIALLALPFAEVSFTFENVSEERQLAFKRGFDLSFQRGGG